MNAPLLGWGTSSIKGLARLTGTTNQYLMWEEPNPGTAIKYTEVLDPDEPLSSGISLYGSVASGPFPWGVPVDPD